LAQDDLGKKSLIKKIPFKKLSLKNSLPKKVAAADCFAAWDIAFYYTDVWIKGGSITLELVPALL
jgi:hypothetical protein